MAEQTPPPTQPPEEPTPPPPPPRKRRHWGRRIAIAVAVVVVLIVILVLLAPTILSTGPVRRFVVGQVNQHLNGHIQISDWSLGWGGPLSISGLHIYDAQNQEILALNHASTQMGLWSALRGNYDLGQTTVDDLNLVRLEIDRDGTTNYQKLAQSSPQTPQQPPAKQKQTTALPQVRGTITVNNLHGTILAAGAPEPLHLDPSHAKIEIPDIDQPIKNSVRVAYHVGNLPPGTIELNGTIDAVANRQVDLKQLSADEQLSVADARLDALSPLFRLMGIDLSTVGVANGQLKLAATGIDQLSATGAIKISDLKATGGLLQGDTYTTKALNIPVDLSIASAGSSAATVQIKSLGIEFDQGKLAASGKAPLDALLSAGQVIAAAIQQAAGQKTTTTIPWHGGNGQLSLTAQIPDVSAIANQLPHLLHLQEGTRLTGGQLNHQTTLTLLADKATLNTETHLTHVTGQHEGKAVTLEPVHLTAGATALPSPALRDLKLALTSGFGSLNGGGASVADLNLTGQFNLKDLQSQLEQFVNLTTLLKASSPVQLAGTGTFQLASQGDPGRADAPLQVSTQLTLSDLKITGLTSAGPIEQSRLAVAAGAAIDRSSAGVQGLRGVNLTMESGPANKPVIDLTVVADQVTLQPALSAPLIKLAKCEIPSLPEAQKQLAAFIPPDFAITAGSLSAGGAASYEGGRFRLTQPLAVHMVHLTLDQVTQGQQRRLLADQPVTLSVLADQPQSDSIHLADVSAQLGEALTAKITGTIAQLSTQRQFNDVQLALDYDLGKLWPVARPVVLSPEQQQKFSQMAMDGKFHRVFHLSGSYPAGQPFNKAIQSLVADGGIALESFTLPEKGIAFGNADIPFTLSKGIVTTGAAGGGASTQPVASAVLNAGKVRLDHLSIDLTGEHPRLTTPDHYQLLQGVTLNTIFAETVLSQFLNNPLWANAKQAEGRLDVSILQCHNLPLDSSLTQPGSTGDLSLQYSVTGLQIGNDLVTGLVQYLAPNAFNNNTLQGAIKDGSISIANGIVTHKTPVSIDKYTLNLDGSVAMASGRFTTPMNLTIPTALFRQKELARVLPELTVPLSGTATQPKLDLGKAIQDNLGKGLLNQILTPQKKEPDNPKTIQENLGKELLNQILTPQKKETDKEPAAPKKPGKVEPPASQPANPLEDLLKNLGKKKK